MVMNGSNVHRSVDGINMREDAETTVILPVDCRNRGRDDDPKAPVLP